MDQGNLYTWERDGTVYGWCISSKGLGFLNPKLLPFPAIWLGRDVRGECSTKTMGMGNKISERGVLPCSKMKKSEKEKVFLF